MPSLPPWLRKLGATVATVAAVACSLLPASQARAQDAEPSDATPIIESAQPSETASATGSLYMALVRVTVGALNTLTFGWLYPLLKHWEITEWCRRIRVDGRHVRFHGSSAALGALWVRVWVLSLVTFGVYW